MLTQSEIWQPRKVMAVTDTAGAIFTASTTTPVFCMAHSENKNPHSSGRNKKPPRGGEKPVSLVHRLNQSGNGIHKRRCCYKAHGKTHAKTEPRAEHVAIHVKTIPGCFTKSFIICIHASPQQFLQCRTKQALRQGAPAKAIRLRIEAVVVLSSSTDEMPEPKLRWRKQVVSLLQRAQQRLYTVEARA